jgi:serine/threonine protein kinase
MNGSLRGLASCKEERPGDPYGAVPCAELMDVARRKGKTIPLPAALRIAREVLDRLDRDRPPLSVDPRVAREGRQEVSPRTIFVGPRGDVSLRVQTDGGEAPDSSGGLPYLAPEQVGGWRADSRCDVFSVGAVLYELLTGKRLFQGNDRESIARNYDADLSAIAEPTARLPLELRLILASALARESDERFQEVRDFADAIRSFAEHVSLPLERGELTSWLGSLDLWPAHSGMFPKSELVGQDGFSDTPLDDGAFGDMTSRRVR